MGHDPYIPQNAVCAIALYRRAEGPAAKKIALFQANTTSMAAFVSSSTHAMQLFARADPPLIGLQPQLQGGPFALFQIARRSGQSLRAAFANNRANMGI